MTEQEHFIIEKSGIEVVFRLKGRLDTNNAPEMESAMGDYLAGHYLIIDFSACNYVSSAGIRVLLKAHKKLLAGNGCLYVAAVPQAVMQVFEMTGLHRILNFEADTETCKSRIMQLKKVTSTEVRTWKNIPLKLTFQENTDTSLRRWEKEELVSFKELGVSIGFGKLAEAFNMQVEDQVFFNLGKCAGFLPTKAHASADFTVPADPENTAMLIKQAFSFEDKPIAEIKSDLSAEFDKRDVKDLIMEIDKINGSELFSAGLMVLKGMSNNQKMVYLMTVLPDHALIEPKESDLYLSHHIADGRISGGVFHLDEFRNEDLTASNFYEWLDQHLSIENIIGFMPLPERILVEAFSGVVFSANEVVTAAKNRLKISCEGNLDLNYFQTYLIRNLYKDSEKIVIKPLHGGFSAQTYQVDSFDKDGRKLRPTVLKIAHKEIIAREAERCQTYALPYIFNNSAVVLGAVFTGKWGALRYNFVGIGGEDSQLQWLSKYVEQHQKEHIEPLLDKIFLQILKPWYGQTVLKEIKPFSEHDPTFTFFPHIFDVAHDVWKITAEEKYVLINDRQYLNPYWFLKHIYSKYRNDSIIYPTAVCHGDLNLQNILLDNSMNVYLIDFSETKPRASISDFARIESIMMVDRAPVDTEFDWIAYADFLETFYSKDILSLDAVPTAEWSGSNNMEFNKQVYITQKMREYARQTVPHHSMIFPYYIALLEWVLPVICYSLPLSRRKMATVAASIMCQRLIESGFD